ncbi:MAG: hypothetical protein RLZZ230_938 [Candidatus Parcubacteria bacterium]|jgi:hypothetical protein
MNIQTHVRDKPWNYYDSLISVSEANKRTTRELHNKVMDQDGKFIYLVNEQQPNTPLAGAGISEISSSSGNLLKIHFYFITKEQTSDDVCLQTKLFSEIARVSKNIWYKDVVIPFLKTGENSQIYHNILCKYNIYHSDAGEGLFHWYKVSKSDFENWTKI